MDFQENNSIIDDGFNKPVLFCSEVLVIMTLRVIQRKYNVKTLKSVICHVTCMSFL